MLSPHYSTYRIARELRLDYAKLKLRIAETAAHDNGPEFFELKAESLFAAGGCSIQLQSPEGFHMVIRAEISQMETVFPGSHVGKPSLSTLRRKLNLYRTEGFDALARKSRKDRGHARAAPAEIIETAIEP